MGFFSDLKEDLSQAVNELIPEEETRAGNEPGEREFSLDEMLKNIDDIRLEEEEAPRPEAAREQDVFGKAAASEEDGSREERFEDDEMERMLERMLAEETAGSEEADKLMKTEEPIQREAPLKSEPPAKSEEPIMRENPVKLEDPIMRENPVKSEEPEAEVPEAAEEQEIPEETILTESKGAEKEMDMASIREAVDETSVITGGMMITGDIVSEGSIDIIGTVNGNIDALGKLNISGHINGNSKAAEIYAESAKINGEVISEGAIKVGASAVIIGNISATSAAIAGAVKGDIDVRGPVILDASAIVMGNIKSKSVQINNGAVIEGMCSQCYADVSPTSFFEDYKPEIRKAKSK